MKSWSAVWYFRMTGDLEAIALLGWTYIRLHNVVAFGKTCACLSRSWNIYKETLLFHSVAALTSASLSIWRSSKTVCNLMNSVWERWKCCARIQKAKKKKKIHNFNLFVHILCPSTAAHTGIQRTCGAGRARIPSNGQNRKRSQHSEIP